MRRLLSRNSLQHNILLNQFPDVYNKYKDTDRPLLAKKTLFNNIYVHTNICDLIEFNPTTAAEYWLNQKDRKPRHGTKSTEQEWFKVVFPDARDQQRHASRKIEF